LWFAIPSTYETCIHYTLPIFTGARAIAFGFFAHRLQAGKWIFATSADFSMREFALLRGLYKQIDTIRSRIQTGSGLFSGSAVKKIPNAIALGEAPGRLSSGSSREAIQASVPI
jgi:hypothetical protein